MGSSSLNVKRLLGNPKKSDLNSCNLLGIKKKKCRKIKKKGRKIVRNLRTKL